MEPSGQPSRACTQERIAARVRQRLFTPQPFMMRMGRFQVLEPIGRGGMGMVYAAYDEQLDRKVAVKVLLEDDLPSEEDRRRFQREAQALARLSHPHVVTVHEVGESDGQFFLAMEYIEGQSLRDWLRTRPNWRQVLAAFLQAGRGLVAAHEAGLVHRDLKPANIMRSDDGAVKVLDFGLARATTEELESTEQVPLSGSSSALCSVLTQTGAIVGTPAYMAPEQYDGEAIDARTDQYSFCVALWEGLTGQRPFQGRTVEAMRKARLAGPPSWPSNGPPVPRSIVRALRRGLAVAPQGRWPSMDALLLHLSPSPPRRRSRWLVGLSAAAALGAAAATAHSWTGSQAPGCDAEQSSLAGIWDDDRRAEVEAALLDTGRPYARRAWDRTRRELDAYAGAWTSGRKAACEASSARPTPSPRVACLDHAALALRSTVDTLADADDRVLSKAHALVAGLPSLSRCEHAAGLLDVPPPSPDQAPVVASTRNHLMRARSLRLAGRYEAAHEAVVQATATLGGSSYGPVRTELLLEQGRVLERRGEFEASAAALSDAMEHASRWGQARALAQAASSQIHVVGAKQQRGEAAMLLRPLALGLPHADPLQEATARNNLANALRVQGKFEEAEAEFRASLALRRGVLGHDDPAVATSRNNLGVALAQRKKYAEAEAELRAAIALRLEVLGPDHPEVAQSRNNLGNVLRAQGKLAEAEAEHRTALALRQRSLNPTHPNIAMSRSNLGIVLRAQGKLALAEAEHRAALALRLEALGADHPSVAASHHNLANALHSQGKLQSAEVELRAALSLAGRTLGSSHPSVATMRHNLANVLQARGEHDEAEAEYRAALALREQGLEARHPSIAESQSDLAAALLEREQLHEALPLAQAAWARHRRGDIPPRHRAQTAFVLARVLWSVDEPQRDRVHALDLAREALHAYRTAEDAAAEDLQQVERWLDTHTRR